MTDIPEPGIEIPPTLGVELRRLRLASGMGLAEASSRSGVSKAALSQWENGNRTPLGPSLDRLLKVLQTPFRLEARLLEATDPVHARIALVHNPLGQPVDIGQVLRALRLRIRMTQSDLAHTIGMTQGAVAKWENGETLPSNEALHAALFVLRPSDEELESLLAARIALPSEEIIDDLEERLRRAHSAPAFPLREVTVGLLQRDTWRAATLTETVDDILIEVLAWKGSWYADSDRREEAAATCRVAIQLGKRCGNWDKAALAATTLAQCIAWDQPDDVVKRVRKNLANWLDKPLTRYWKGWVLVHCGYLSQRLDDVDAMEQYGHAALEPLAEFRKALFGPPYIGVEDAFDLIAYAQVRRGYPDRALEILASVPDIGERGFFCWPDIFLTYIRARCDMGEKLPAGALEQVVQFRESYREYPVRQKEWQVIERTLRRRA